MPAPARAAQGLLKDQSERKLVFEAGPLLAKLLVPNASCASGARLAAMHAKLQSRPLEPSMPCQVRTRLASRILCEPT